MRIAMSETVQNGKAGQARKEQGVVLVMSIQYPDYLMMYKPKSATVMPSSCCRSR